MDTDTIVHLYAWQLHVLQFALVFESVLIVRFFLWPDIKELLALEKKVKNMH